MRPRAARWGCGGSPAYACCPCSPCRPWRLRGHPQAIPKVARYVGIPLGQNPTAEPGREPRDGGSPHPPRLPLPCGWWADVAQCSQRLRVGPLFSDGGVSGPGSLWPQGTRPSFWAVRGPLPPPLGTRRASRRASSLTAPPGRAPPTPPGLCNQSRSAGSPARAGSHRYQLTAWVPFPFTQGRLTMADSPHGGPGPPPRERSRPAIGPHDLTPRRGGPPLPTGRTNGAFSGCQRAGSGRNRPPVPARPRGCLFPSV